MSSRKKREQKSVRVFFSTEEYLALEEFRNVVNSDPESADMNMSKLCRHAVFYAVSDSKRRAQQMAQQAAEARKSQENSNGQPSEAGETLNVEKQRGESSDQNATGTDAEVSGSQATDSGALANETPGGTETAAT